MPKINIQYNNETVAIVGSNSSLVLPVKDLIMLSDISIIVPEFMDAIDDWDGSGIIVENELGQTFIIDYFTEEPNAYGTTVII